VTRQRRVNVPIVTTLHGSDVRFAARSLPGRVMMRRTLRRCRRVTAVSNHLAAEAARISGVSPVVAPMPADTSLFVPAAAERDGLLFVGKLDAQKGLAVVIDALAMVPDVTLTVVGDGIDARRLREQAVSRRVDQRISWAGRQPQDALPAYYRRARLVVAPAVAPEGLGLTAVEALLCETPVVGSDLGGTRDVVSHEATGLLVPPGDARALADGINAALSALDRLAAWGREGRARMLSRFSPESAARAYAAVYREAIGDRP
jgi:glycosyltransferase involved in cell wall biosynthesis